AQTLLPEGNPEKQVILERVLPEEMTAYKWTDGYYTAIRPGRPQRVKVASPAPPKIQYWVLGLAEVNLGRDVTIKVDGRVLANELVTTTRGAWTLPYVAPGAHTVVVETDAPNLRILLDQEPAGGGEIVALRNFYRMSGKLRVTARRPAGDQPTTINIILYSTSREPDAKTQYRITLDGGAPRHAEGVALMHFSPGMRTAPMPPADREPILGFADTADRTVYHPRFIAVGLGDDLAPRPPPPARAAGAGLAAQHRGPFFRDAPRRARRREGDPVAPARAGGRGEGR